MDVVAAVADAGLSAAIKAGLHRSLMTKAAFGDQAAVDVKKAQLTSAVLHTTLGRHVVNAWAERTGGDSTDFEAFKASGEFTILARYLTLKDATVATKPSASQFHEARPLGKGGFGIVYLSFKKDSGMPVAVKKMLKSSVKDKGMVPAALIEREVLAKVNSRFVVNLLYAWQDSTWLGLVLTLCPGGDLLFQISQQYFEGRDEKTGKKIKKAAYGGFQPSVLRFYAASIALGLDAIHQAGYVYRDVKPGNVLLDLRGQVRISDMGLTVSVAQGAIKQSAGTRGYWAPEIIKHEFYQTEPDWFSLGATIFVLYCDRPTFGTGDEAEVDRRTCEEPIEHPEGISEELKGLIDALCTKDKAARLGCQGRGVEELKEHPYFNDFDWVSLAAGTMEAELIPDPNDINAPSASELESFKKNSSSSWTEEDEKMTAAWDYFNSDEWDEEAIMLMTRRKELSKLGEESGGGGCCSLS